MDKILDYLRRKRGIHTHELLKIKGHLRIDESVNNIKRTVFDNHNLIVDEGKGYLMDFLASLGYGASYQIKPFGAIVLTSNTSGEVASDTFLNAVDGNISDEGVLHIPSWTNVTHVEGSLTIQLSGSITSPYGNDPANNHINSVCVVSGINAASGGPAQSAYVVSGNEKLFSRVNVGDLVKTSDKAYTFNWTFEIF